MSTKVPGSLRIFNFVWTSICIFIFGLLAVSNFFNMGRPGYNKNVLLVYGLGACVGVVACLIFGFYGVFNFVKVKASGSEIPFQAGHVSESSNYLFLSKSWLGKITPHIIWVIIIIITASTGFRVWGEPDIYSGVTEFAAASEGTYAYNTVGIPRTVWDVAINPGFTEDMASLLFSAVLVALLLFGLWLAWKITKNRFFKFNSWWYGGAVLISCPIAALGLGFIPGFAQAHTVVGGQNIAYLFATWAFQTMNLYVMWFTGLFLPIAHILHNALFSLGYFVSLSIAVMAIPLIRRYKNA